MNRNQRIRWMDNNLAAAFTPITSPSETTLKPYSNLFTDSRSELWESESLNEEIVYDFVYQTPIGFIGLIGPHDQEIGVSLAANITVEGNNINDWTSAPFSQQIKVTDQGALGFLDTDDGVPSYRYWRITIEDTTSSNSSISFGYLYLGDYTSLEQRNVRRGFSRTLTDPAKTTQSENGALYFDTKTKYLEFTGVSIGFLKASDRANLEAIFNEFGVGKPMFVSFDPTLKVSTDLNEMTRFMIFRDRPFFQHVHTDVYTMNLQLREFV